MVIYVGNSFTPWNPFLVIQFVGGVHKFLSPTVWLILQKYQSHLVRNFAILTSWQIYEQNSTRDVAINNKIKSFLSEKQKSNIFLVDYLEKKQSSLSFTLSHDVN